MESAKRLCLESTEDSLQNMQSTGISMMSLNDHCILKIFEYFNINQLCVVAGICKRLFDLVDMFFRQRFRNRSMDEVRIQITFGREIILLTKERYVMHFLKFMSNLRLCEGFNTRPFDMAEFMRQNCNENLQIIAFERINFGSDHGSVIMNWLRNVEAIAFFNCKHLHQITRYCSNLKRLKIDRYSKDQEWMEEVYPTLEHLQYNVSCKKKLIKFLTRNRTVKSLMLTLDTTSPAINQKLLKELQQFNLEELMLTIERINVLEWAMEQLKSTSNRSHFKRLELCVNDPYCFISKYREIFSSLKELMHLRGLHLLQCEIQFPSDITLEHLKVLQLAHVAEYISTDSLSENLPNLEELYLMALSANFKDIVTPFARNAEKLKKIVARDFKIANRAEMTNIELAKYFNVEREQLRNACKLFIYIGKDEFDETLNATAAKFPLVEMRRVEFQLKEIDFVQPFLNSFAF